MGACLSRKKHSSSPPSNNVPLSAVIESLREDLPEPKIKTKLVTEEDDKEKEKVKKQVAEEEGFVKKEIFVIKHRKSHDRERPSVSIEEENKVSGSVSASAATNNNENGSNVVVRTSSCTKEEVDAILIQCGRLSRSSSSTTPAAKAASSSRKYAGSKRSLDLDNDQDVVADYEEEEDEMGANTRQHRQRHRQSGRQTHSSPSQGRRSRERDKENRSGSRERGNGSGRRVSRSPNRRSETNPTPNSNSSTTTRPGKMVSVPATDKSNNGVESQTANGVKRISVKRNVTSPRSQSPARTHSPARMNANQPLLSRSNSRKAEQSPYRRNPLSEIDTNSLAYAQTTGNNKASNGNNMARKNREAELQTVVKEVVNQAQVQRTNKVVVVEEGKSMPQTLARSRSARRSRDFDFNPENSINQNPSYTALLLEDIQSFHQKNSNTSTNTNTNADGSNPVPACLTKACSILEAVADLNSTTSSNLSCTFLEGKQIRSSTVGKDPFVESEIVVSDDLMEPSLHKYVTVRRGGNGMLCGEDVDGQESSGSNSFISGAMNQHWGYSVSSREPNSMDSTDRWTSRSNTKEDDVEEGRRGLFSEQRSGIGRRVDATSKTTLHSISTIVAAAST